MEKKLLKEQRGFHGYHTAVSRSEPLRTVQKGREPLSRGTHTRKVVKSPRPVPASTWTMRADRRAQLRRRPGETYTVLVPRSLIQTGVPVSSGRMQALRRSSVTPVPVRSGHGRRKGFFARLLALLLVLTIAVIGVNFALTSPGFSVQQVNVVGTQNPALVSNIEHMGIQDQNIFLVDTTALTARIETVPTVASADVEKQWPNQVTVIVVERVAVLLWQTKQGVYAVDKQGVVIAPASNMVGTDQLMTVIDTRGHQVGLSGQQIGPGVRLNQADVAFAQQISAQLPRVKGITNFTLRYNAADVAATGGSGSYVVEDASGWVAYLGSASDANPLDNRLAELQQILALAQKQQLNLATIDLRFGLRPVYTLKS